MPDATMEVDSENDVLISIAQGGLVEDGTWPALRGEILTRLDKIAHEDFPIPNLAAPSTEPRLLSPLPSSPLEPSSPQDADKENAPAPAPAAQPEPAIQPLEPGTLPKQIADLLDDIKSHIGTFTTHPPHTVQRLAELILKPRAHYRALASYLHAVDRVVQVTSGSNIYPLPPPIPDMSSMNLNGEDPKDPAVAVAWSNPTVPSVGSDEALGGALLTPIPWLSKRSPESSEDNDTPGAQIHSESTETIEGPNGMGSVETVSVSVNGVPSMGHTRGVTQGELLRQEQRAGVVPVSQLSRSHENGGEEEEGEDGVPKEERDCHEQEDDEMPHARGPEEIGVNDTGPQGPTTSFKGENGVATQGIDVEAAVGRKHDEEGAPHEADSEVKLEEDAADVPKSPGADSIGTKRDAEEDDLEGEPAKKAIKEGTEDKPVKQEDADTATSAAGVEATSALQSTEGEEVLPKTETETKTDEIKSEGDEDKAKDGVIKQEAAKDDGPDEKMADA